MISVFTHSYKKAALKTTVVGDGRGGGGALNQQPILSQLVQHRSGGTYRCALKQGTESPKWPPGGVDVRTLAQSSHLRVPQSCGCRDLWGDRRGGRTSASTRLDFKKARHTRVSSQDVGRRNVWAWYAWVKTGGGGGVLKNTPLLEKSIQKPQLLANRNTKSGLLRGTCDLCRICGCVRVFLEGAGVCGLSVYLRGGAPHRPQQFQA